MDSEGRIQSMEYWSKELGEEELQRRLDNNLLREVSEDDMTEAQKERYQDGEQPVVKKRDYTSLLSQVREKMRVEEKKIANRRKKNKAAKKARRKNRK